MRTDDSTPESTPTNPDDPKNPQDSAGQGGMSRRDLLRSAGLVGLGGIGGIGLTGAGVYVRRARRTAAKAAAAATPTVDPSKVYLSKYLADGKLTVWSMKYRLTDSQTEPAVYNTATQGARHQALMAKKMFQSWAVDSPLMVLDPYGTTRTGLYVYFDAATSGKLSVSCATASTATFSAVAANHASKGFEGLVVALVPGARNTLTLTWTPTSGAKKVITASIPAPATLSGYGTQISASVSDESALTPGLFALTGVVGPQGNNTYLFDNHGVMRAELLATDQEHYHVVVEDGRLITNTSSSQISVLDHLGHADPIIDFNGYTTHHDLVVVGDIVYALASRSGSGRVEDRVLRIDLNSGEVAECVDLQKVLPNYEKLAHTRSTATADPYGVVGEDWAHLNTVQVVGDVMYLSSRETSTIIALDNALDADSTPSVRYMIGTPALWKGTGYQKHFLTASGSPTGNAGQHSVERIHDPELPAGQYYLEMFNNNYWYLGTRADKDWKGIGPSNASATATKGTSHWLRYLVDEKAGTYKEAFRVDVPYSSVVSNVFRLGGGTISDNAVVHSGKAYLFSERRPDGTVLATYRYDSTSLGYRAYKDSFKGFWYA